MSKRLTKTAMQLLSVDGMPAAEAALEIAAFAPRRRKKFRDEYHLTTTASSPYLDRCFQTTEPQI